MPLILTKHSITMFIIVTLNKMTLSITTQHSAADHNDTQHNGIMTQNNKTQYNIKNLGTQHNSSLSAAIK
jgi:hypothetical protein